MGIRRIDIAGKVSAANIPANLLQHLKKEFSLDDRILIELTADIVAAHVENNSVAVGDVAHLIQQVHQALAGLGEQEVEVQEKKSPVVSIRSSVKDDYITCMECGKKQKTLRRHLMAAHGMTPEQYRSDYGLPDTYPMTASNYSEQRRAMAHSIGLGRKKAGEGDKPARKQGRAKKKHPAV